MFFVWWASAGLAYESDTLTDRDRPLPDVTDAIDDWVNDVIAGAVIATNEKTRCEVEDPEEVLRILAHEVHDRTAPDELVTNRGGGLRAYGFDQLSAWIEYGGVEHRNFNDRRDLFGSLTWKESPLLVWAGVTSTVKVNGQLIGTDKLDHFFEEGYHAWRHARWGEDPEEGVVWAVHTENGKYGLDTSRTFSFGDLRADHDGTVFYETLLSPSEGVATIGEDGCVSPTRRFTWRDWVTWEYDEVLNPPVYTEAVQIGVTRHLEEHRDEYCASYQAWGGPEYEQRLQEVLSAPIPDYYTADAPPRTDPYRLAELCSSTAVDAGRASDSGSSVTASR